LRKYCSEGYGRRLEDNIKLELKNLGFNDVDQINLAQLLRIDSVPWSNNNNNK
jgi:hypothetical protein